METTPPLSRRELTEIVDLALQAGQILMQSGAETQRIENTVHMLGTGLGADWGDVYVSSSGIIVTHVSAGEFRTRVRRVAGAGVNMTRIAAISHLTHRVNEGKFNRPMVAADLKRISNLPRHYNRWLTTFAVALACAAFSALFDGGPADFAVTFVAAGVAMLLRQEMLSRGFNALLAVVAAAFTVGVVAHLAWRLRVLAQPDIALAAAALFLVPGVAYINALEDLIKGHTDIGMARGMRGTLVIFAIALGLILSMALLGGGA